MLRSILFFGLSLPVLLLFLATYLGHFADLDKQLSQVMPYM